MALTGFEPACPRGHRGLSPARLPKVPPQGQKSFGMTGFEPSLRSALRALSDPNRAHCQAVPHPVEASDGVRTRLLQLGRLMSFHYDSTRKRQRQESNLLGLAALTDFQSAPVLTGPLPAEEVGIEPTPPLDGTP